MNDCRHPPAMRKIMLRRLRDLRRRAKRIGFSVKEIDGKFLVYFDRVRFFVTPPVSFIEAEFIVDELAFELAAAPPQFWKE